MKKQIGRRIAAICSVAVLGAGAACMFAGCTSKHPEVTITYSFNDKDYKVEYTLSRLDAPQTVKHFIELADAGYYDGTIIHDYDESHLFGGGYTLNEDKNGITAKDYFAELPRLEKEKGITFTQSVWMLSEGHAPLYTVYGEFSDNAYEYGGKEYRHQRGALVMYYSQKDFNRDVRTIRNDGGKNNDETGEKYDSKAYKYNSATSLFYTYYGGGNTALDKQYAVFGMVKNYSDQLEPLIKAINEYKEGLPEEEVFTETTDEALDKLDHLADFFSAEVRDYFAAVRTLDKVTYNTPIDKPIIIKSVKVNKY